jgi:hypothetical protein
MTWDELKEEAKKMDAEIYINPYDNNFERIDYKSICFFKSGTVSASDDAPSDRVYGKIYLEDNRTPDQMLAIMKALQ